jgi:hypothetical protein
MYVHNLDTIFRFHHNSTKSGIRLGLLQDTRGLHDEGGQCY